MLTGGEASATVPEGLDHILLGCNDLTSGINFVEVRTGLRAAFGGIHPGRGTENALLSVGERHYLEIIAPDRAQPHSQNPLCPRLVKLTAPRLVQWAAHPGDLRAFAKKLQQAGWAIEGPISGSRKRPDGGLLEWQTLTLKDNACGLLPFFIEWRANSLHPSADSPAGCKLIGFELVTPEAEKLAKTLALLCLEVPIVNGEKPQLRATLSGPQGILELTS